MRSFEIFLTGPRAPGASLKAVKVLSIVLLALLPSACVHEPDGIEFPCIRPEVVRTVPALGDTGVAPQVVITATFSTPMDPSSFAPGTVLLLASDTIPGTISYNPADTTVTFVPNDSLPRGTTYTVYISPQVADTKGNAMDTAYTWTFTTAGPASPAPGPVDSIPEAPILLSPADGTGGVLPLATTLTWNPSARAVTYRLQVSTSPLFTAPVYDAPGLTGTSQLAVGLLPFSTYYWRVNATNSAGTSPWSLVWSFSTLL
jgi:hypothetical protein